MSRLIALACCLLMGLIPSMGQGEIVSSERQLPPILPVELAPTHDGRVSPLDGPTISAASPGQETALFQEGGDRTDFLARPLLVTDEAAESQLHLGEIAHLRWHRFARTPVAPFAYSRSLPLLI